MREFTRTEKETAMRLIMDRISYENEGMMKTSSAGVSMREHMDFIESGWNIEYNKNRITLNGEEAYKIVRKYSSRKTNMQYRQLNPHLEYLG